MTRVTEGLARSVQTRLASHARAIGVDPNLVLTRFATERLLYRLSVSPHAGRFVLKGALLLLAWLGETLRPTRDADLLGFGDLSDVELDRIFRELCASPVAPDGMTFAPDSIRVSAIRLDDRYGGRRVTLLGELGRARLRVQVDVGIGDAVVPPAEWLEYPSLLGFARPRLRAYRRETVVAEKLHAMVVLGSKNSRLRDFFDVQALAQREAFDGPALTNALRATFERRATTLPDRLPLALTPQFAASEEKQSQWRGFLRRSGVAPHPGDLGTVVDGLARFLGPVLDAAGAGSDFRALWKPGGPWVARPKTRIRRE
jgi:predicted nucleotidyltransferase component of viral defense system